MIIVYVHVQCRCSDYQKEVDRLRINKRVRVCRDCYERHRDTN